MKNLVLIMLFLGLISMTACKKAPEVNMLLQNEETRMEVFDSIATNPKYMQEFMEQLRKSEPAMKLMRGNKPMMSAMMKGPGMKMMRDSSMMKDFIKNRETMGKMMRHIVSDTAKMNNLMSLMQEKGFMSENCKRSSMKMMQEKLGEKN